MGVPAIDSQSVTRVAVQIKARGRLDCGDRALRMDDYVRLQLEGRVVAVALVEDERTGELVYIQTIRVTDDVGFAPFTVAHRCRVCGSDDVAAAAADTGVVRAGRTHPAAGP